MTTPANARTRLIEIVKDRSFESGREITLASGKKSTLYFNMKPTMMTAEGAHLIASLTLDMIAEDNVDYIGGLEMGAVPLAAAVAAVSQTQDRPLAAFFVRKASKEHGTRQLIEGLAPGESLSGKRVVIIEDVTTTGGSAIKAAQQVEAEGATITRCVTVVDRREGAEQAFADAGLKLSSILDRSDFV